MPINVSFNPADLNAAVNPTLIPNEETFKPAQAQAAAQAKAQAQAQA